jgi:hypothetical protein
MGKYGYFVVRLSDFIAFLVKTFDSGKIVCYY